MMEKASKQVACAVGIFAMGYLSASILPDLIYRFRFRGIDFLTSEMSTVEKVSNHGEDTVNCFVWPSDIDRNGHVNNARFLRELNFSRRRFFFRMGLWPILNEEGVNMMVQAQTIRYRKELKLFDRFVIRTKIVAYSNAEKCYYVESRFETSQQFVIAIHHAKYKMVSRNKGGLVREPQELLSAVGLANYSGVDVDTNPGKNAMLESWIESQRISSKELNPNKK